MAYFLPMALETEPQREAAAAPFGQQQEAFGVEAAIKEATARTMGLHLDVQHNQSNVTELFLVKKDVLRQKAVEGRLTTKPHMDGENQTGKLMQPI